MTRIACRRSISGNARLFLAAALVLLACPAPAAEQPEAESARTQVGDVFVCDSIVSGKPQGRSVVFSAAQGTLFCYSDFVLVAAPEQITHVWFFRDREISRFRLTIQPPRWSSYSSLKIPPGSKGPWRVDVLGENGELYGVARFSILD